MPQGLLRRPGARKGRLRVPPQGPVSSGYQVQSLTSLPLSPLLWASFQLFYKGLSKKAGIRQSFLQFTALEIIILT